MPSRAGIHRHSSAPSSGLACEHPAVYLNDVGGWLPLTAIETATRLTELHSMRAAMSRTHTGAVTSQGDYVQGSAALRSSNPTLDGHRDHRGYPV